MTNYSFPNQMVEWKRLPVDNVGYIDPKQLIKADNHFISGLYYEFEKNRYGLDGWRNHKNKWREKLGLDSTTGKTIMDFGCGFGLEATQFAKAGNKLILADINQDGLTIANRYLNLVGNPALESCLVTGEYPFFEVKQPYDIFYSNGVLHHTPEFRNILKRACEDLAADGEVRLMLYSDVGWVIATNAMLPEIDAQVALDPNFWKFVRFFDEVGTYADWYNRDKIEYLVGDFLRVESCEYITNDDRYLVAILKKR